MIQEGKSTWPLMHDNVSRSDLNRLVEYLSHDDPRLTHGPKVREFEKAWADWLGVSYAVMVNSGSSANDLTMLALRELRGPGEVILSPLGWVSDVAAILHAGLQPVFVDIDPNTLGPDPDKILNSLSPVTRAVLVVHVLGLNALHPDLVDVLEARDVPLVEDVCESHGATFGGRKCGAIGFASNFSFYYAHHLTTIEGGAVCTDDADFADCVRMLRSHGLVRESGNPATRDYYEGSNPELNKEFIFAYAGHNNRPTELNGVLGLSQLPRLDQNIAVRQRNFRQFMTSLDGGKFRTGFDTSTSSNYGLILVLREADWRLRDKVEEALRQRGVEFRRGLSGGGNQLRQPYLRHLAKDIRLEEFPNVEHVHHFGWYLGNYPGVSEGDIDRLCSVLNAL